MSRAMLKGNHSTAERIRGAMKNPLGKEKDRDDGKFVFGSSEDGRVSLAFSQK